MILYFSGTGNSKHVALTLSKILDERVMAMTPDMRSGMQIQHPDTRIIWVFPIYSWGVPPYVMDVIKGINLTDKSSVHIHHAVVTCGDDCGLADRMWRRAINKRGWSDGAILSVQMPNNYVAMMGFDVDSKELETEKLANSSARITHVAETILECEKSETRITDIVHGNYAWIKTRVIYPWFKRYAMGPEKFSVTESCISCGKCADMCPLGNISMKKDNSGDKRHPEWGKDCAGCLGCYHTCPVHAIDYAHATNGKGQYLNPQIRQNR